MGEVQGLGPGRATWALLRGPVPVLLSLLQLSSAFPGSPRARAVAACVDLTVLVALVAAAC